MGFSIQRDDLVAVARKMRAAASASRAEQGGIIRRAALTMERDLKDIALNGGRPRRVGLFMESKPGFNLGTRTGAAAASVTSFVARSGDQVSAHVGSPLKYVRYNEEGATVTPSGGKAIVVPTVNALTAAGALKNMFAGLRTLRDARTKSGKRLFVYKGKRRGTDGAWLAGMEGEGAGRTVRDAKSGRWKRGGRLVLYFLLRSRAEIPARFMFRNAKRRVEPEIVADAGEGLVVAIDGALR